MCMSVPRSKLLNTCDPSISLGAHTPMAFTRKLAAGLTEWSAEAGVPLDNDAVRRICWKYYLKEKERVVTNAEWLSPECNYRLFLIYNRLLLKEDTTELEVGQVNLTAYVQTLSGVGSPVVKYNNTLDHSFGEPTGPICAFMPEPWCK